MSDLIDRISGIDEIRRINLHRWIGAQRLYALGEWTRAQIATEFSITGNADEERQAGQIANNIDAQSNATTKAIYIGRAEAVFMCVEDFRDRLYHNVDSTVNKAKIFEDLQIAG